MRNKSIIFLFALIFMIVFSLSAVSADDLQNADSGTVSGDVDVATVNPWTTSGELTYDVPSEAKDIKRADLYVNVYSGSAQNTYGANANVSINTTAGEKQIAAEQLWIEDGSADATIYTVNDHVNKCYSDFQMYYDLTDTFKGLNGSSISIKVDTFKMENKSFDGRIKLIALILAYDDGDNDTINYWVDSTQKWTKTNVTTTFATESAFDIVEAELINIALSSGDGSYRLNGELLGDAENHTSGNYYQYNYWNVTDKVKEGYNTELLSLNTGTGTYSSLKNVLTLLKVKSDIISAEVSFATEYANTCYAGTNNTLRIDVNADKEANYTVELLADGNVVNSTAVALDGENQVSLLLTDPTIREIDETTVKGANNNNVTYSVNVKYGNAVVGEASNTVPILYNGNLGYDFEYGIPPFTYKNFHGVTGDVVIDIKNENSYLGTSNMNRTDVWTVNLNNESLIKGSFLFIPYNWFNALLYNETEDMFNVTFNGVSIKSDYFYRDQSNLGNYGVYGYGVLIYDVTNLLNASGENTLVLNKNHPTPAVYPSTLVYLYDTPKGNLKDICVSFGVDLLANSNNNAGRTVKSDNYYLIEFNPENTTFYALAAGAQSGEGNILFGNTTFNNVWNGSTKTTDLFKADVSESIVNGLNNVSFVATGGTILVLPQILVTEVGNNFDIDSIETEYDSTCYAGTNNTLTVTVSCQKEGEFTFVLFDENGLILNSTAVNLTSGTNKVLLTDPTIRPVNDTTVNGAENKKITYFVAVYYNGYPAVDSLTVPVLYNGNLGYDKEYDAEGLGELSFVNFFNGEFVVDIQNESTYLGVSNMNRTDVWTLSLDKDSSLVMGELLIPYNWFNGKIYNETEDMFDLTFNGVSLNQMYLVDFTRDQSNLGNYGKYGYGVLVYDVTTLIKTSGDNTLVLNKNYPTPAVYPGVLVYAYNTPRSNFKTVFYNFGADLLANSSNKAGRIAKSDSRILFDDDDMDNVNFSLYMLAAGAQAGEGNLVFNDKEFTDIWNGTSKTTDLFVVDVTDNVLPVANNISFVATGGTILALPQYMLIDQGYYYNIDSIETEYKNTVYAGTTNTLAVTVTTSVAGEFTLDLFVDDSLNPVNSTTVNLTVGTNKVFITDPRFRPIDETTVNGADNIKVTYIVVLSSKFGDWVVNKNTTASVLYNGNLGYDMEYNVTGFEGLFVNKKFNGDVIIDIKDSSSYLGSNDMNRTDVWNINLDENSIIDDAYLIIPYNWFNPTLGNETEDMFNITFNGREIVPIAHYRDQSNLGGYGDYGYGVFVYGVSYLVNGSGDNTIVLNKNYKTPAVYPSTLIYFYENPNESLKVFSMVIGADLLANTSNNAGRLVKSDSVIDVDYSGFEDVVLYVLAAGAQKGESNIIANDKVFEDVWSGSSKSTNLFAANITDVLADVNNISFVATGSTILALPQIIVGDTGIIMSIDSIETEYKNTCFAGTNNTLTVTVTTNKEGEYELSLFSNINQVASLKVNLTNGTQTILLTDPTIRPIDETTVNGAENDEVYYAVAMYKGDYFVADTLTVPVLYNGYLGKDLEYNSTYIEDKSVIEFNGQFLFYVQDDSTYAGSAATNRTDVWTIDLDNKSHIVKSFVYLAYNWDKSGANGPVVNVTFNGQTISPKAHYRDQSNLGSSGKYGYGLFIFDVTDLAVKGNNTLVLNKPAGLTAFYPSNLMYVYNTTEAKYISKAYLADGVDLLYNAYNKAGRAVETYSQIDVDTKESDLACLFVFAASAQKGEGDLIINGEKFIDVWKGSSNGIEMFDYEYDVNTLNNISFIATGSTILALNQILIVSKEISATEFKDIVVDGNSTTISAVLVGKDGKAIANESIIYSVNGVENTTVTGENGEFTIPVASNAFVEIKFAGTPIYLAANMNITLKDLAHTKAASVIKSEAYTTYAIDYYAGERGNYFEVQLVDANGNPLANKEVKIGFNGVVYDEVTNETGWAKLQINLKNAGTYTFAVAFLGDDDYNASFVVQKITVNKKKTSISASAKSYKASAKTKKYTVTLKTDKGSSIDGKVYMASGKKVTLKLNGKTYTAKTNSKGQATFSLKITKKGKFSTTVKFAGDNTYASSSKSVKITIK